MATLIASVVVLLLGLGLMQTPQHQPETTMSAPLPQSPSPSARQETPTSATTKKTPTTKSTTAAASGRPTRLLIDSIDTTLSIEAVGVDASGWMALPPRPDKVGWYRFGPAPGARRGTAVLAGHVDSKRYGIGPLARLKNVRPGQSLAVQTTAGTHSYTITTKEAVPREDLPVDELFSRTGPERLVVITCTGPYRPGEGYRDNLVLTALPSPS